MQSPPLTNPQEPTNNEDANMAANDGNAPPPYSPNQGGGGGGAPAEAAEHLNIKVTDNNNEVFFKIKRTTQLKKLMDAFCDRQGRQPSSVRFLFEGVRVGPTDTPDSLEMADGDTLEVHQEQIGGQCH